MKEATKYIPIIENEEAIRGGELIQYYKVLIPQNTYSNLRFENRTHAILSSYTGQILSDVNSVLIFTADKIERNKKFETSLTITHSDVKNQNTETLEFLKLTQLMAVPTYEVVSALDKNGGVKDIVNAPQIYQKWLEVFDLLKQEFVDEKFITTIENAGHTEFHNTGNTLSKILLYSVFYFPIFQKEFTLEKSFSHEILESSHLLQGETLDICLNNKSVSIDGDQIVFQFEGRAQNSAELLKKAMQSYQPIIPAEGTNHQLEMNIELHIDPYAGHPLYIKVYLKESLENVLFYEQEFEIKLLSEE